MVTNDIDYDADSDGNVNANWKEIKFIVCVSWFFCFCKTQLRVTQANAITMMNDIECDGNDGVIDAVRFEPCF